MIHLLSKLTWCMRFQDNFPACPFVARDFLESTTIASATYYATLPEHWLAIEKCTEAAEKLLGE